MEEDQKEEDQKHVQEPIDRHHAICRHYSYSHIGHRPAGHRSRHHQQAERTQARNEPDKQSTCRIGSKRMIVRSNDHSENQAKQLMSVHEHPSTRKGSGPVFVVDLEWVRKTLDTRVHITS